MQMRLRSLLLILRLWMRRVDLFENDGACGVCDEERVVEDSMCC
jgi:hypothetical protein